MLKFRSMVVGSDYTDLQVTHDDSRVTLIEKLYEKRLLMKFHNFSMS